MEISKDHPRYKSLSTRERLSELAKEGIVTITGLIAHGRGEAFDYLLGERTIPEAREAERVAVSYLLEARNPVISVNGNVAALCPEEIVQLSEAVPAKIEVNLFHRTSERIEKVIRHMEGAGAETVLGRDPDSILPGISSDRAMCTREGIYTADVVLVPLEDGDRAEALVAMEKVVLAIDLNPVSRTSKAATVTIVDEVTRAIPEMTLMVDELRDHPETQRRMISSFDNRENIRRTIERISRHLESQVDKDKE